MTPKERITSLIASMGYTVSACSEKADLITTLCFIVQIISINWNASLETGIVFGYGEQHTMMTGIILKPEDR